MSLLSLIKILQGIVISLIKFLHDFVISPTHLSYHNLTSFRKERTWKFPKFVAIPVTNLVKKALVPCKRTQKMPSPCKISVRTCQIKSNPLVTNHKYRASDPVKKIFH